MLNKQLTIF